MMDSFIKEGGTLIGFFFTLLAGVFGYGKLHNKVEKTEASIGKLEELFMDSDHNPRLMTIAEHEIRCSAANKLVCKELSQINTKQNESMVRDNELNARIRKIEDATLKMSISIEQINKSMEKKKEE